MVYSSRGGEATASSTNKTSTAEVTIHTALDACDKPPFRAQDAHKRHPTAHCSPNGPSPIIYEQPGSGAADEGFFLVIMATCSFVRLCVISMCLRMMWGKENSFWQTGQRVCPWCRFR